MAESTVIRNKRDETIVISHAGSGTYTVAYEVGDFEVDHPLEGVDNYLDRGVMPSTPSIRKGDDQPITGSFTVHLRDSVLAADVTMLDLAVIFAGGAASAWTSTMGTNSDVVTYTMSRTIVGAAFGSVDRTLVYPFCVFRASESNGNPSTVKVSFTSYALRPTFS